MTIDVNPTFWAVFLIIAGVLVVIDIFESRGRSLTPWAVLLVIVYLLFS